MVFMLSYSTLLFLQNNITIDFLNEIYSEIILLLLLAGLLMVLIEETFIARNFILFTILFFMQKITILLKNDYSNFSVSLTLTIFSLLIYIFILTLGKNIKSRI